MRTLNNNQITQKLSTTKAFSWNAKRRFKQNNKEINPLNKLIMRTLNTNQLSEKMSTTRAYAWNSKRRYRR